MDTVPGVLVAAFLLLALAAGFGPGFDLDIWDDPERLPAYSQMHKPVPADAECVALWNQAGGTTAGQRRLLGIRSTELVVHVERLRNATRAAGTCGVVVATRSDGQTLATFAWGHNGAAGYNDITGHGAARMYGRADAASRVNAVMRPDGTLVPVTPPSG